MVRHISIILIFLPILFISCLKPMENRMDEMLAEIKKTNEKMDSVNGNMGEMKKLSAKMDNLEQMMVYMQEMSADLKEMKNTFAEANLGPMGKSIENLLTLMDELKTAMVGENQTDQNSMLGTMKKLSENMVTLIGAMTGADENSLVNIMNELSTKMDKMSETMGGSEGGLIKVVEDMKNSLDFLKNYMSDLKEEMRKLREDELHTMNNSLHVFTRLLTDLGVSGSGGGSGGSGSGRGSNGGGFDNILDGVSKKLEGSSTGAAFKLVMQSEKDKVLVQAIANYNSGSPEVRYAAIGQIIAYGTLDPLITAFTGIDGGILEHRPLNADRISVNISQNRLELKRDLTGFKYNKVMERAIGNSLEWTLGAAGVITQVRNNINDMQKIPKETAEIVDRAAIVAVFKMNELSDNTEDIESITKKSSVVGRILQRLWPLDNLRINGIENQSRLMVEWYAPRLVCKLQLVEKMLQFENTRVKDFAKADIVTMNELHYIARVLMVDTVKRYLTVQGYGPEPLAVKRRQKLIDSDNRRKGFKASEIQKVLDPDWKTYRSMCSDLLTFEEYVDFDYTGDYPEEKLPNKTPTSENSPSSELKKLIIQEYKFTKAALKKVLDWFHL